MLHFLEEFQQRSCYRGVPSAGFTTESMVCCAAPGAPGTRGCLHRGWATGMPHAQAAGGRAASLSVSTGVPAALAAQENSWQKAYMQVPEGTSAVLCTAVDPLSTAAGLVQVHDCLLAVRGARHRHHGAHAPQLKLLLMRRRWTGSPWQMMALLSSGMRMRGW